MKRMLCLVSIAALAGAAQCGECEWISVPSAPVFTGVVRGNSRAADGTSWFACTFTNSGEIASAKWTVAGLGVFEVFVNGERVGDDFLKPGFTHCEKTKYSFSYDVAKLLKRDARAANILAAEVSAGWWRDKIVTPAGRKGFVGKKSAFRGKLELVYSDGRREVVATGTDGWRCGVAGSVTHAAIFDGEEFDARVKDPVLGEGLCEKPEVNDEFKGEILPTQGAEVCLRRDLAMARGPYSLKKGETLVVDFAQNCAAVPEFRFRAKRGAVLTALPAEMLNDADKGERGCDGPKGSVYRANLRVPDDGMRAVYTFAGDGVETYMPRFTFFGYRYISITATDDVEIERVASIPVTSIKRDMELGRLETGDRSLNRFIANVYWGQLSNYLSVPTDCPQRNERLGWTADTQVFCQAGAFNADTRSFFRKWMRDMRDSQHPQGGFPGVAPFAQYGNDYMRTGWSDAGIIVPYSIWLMFGDVSIVADNWSAMERCMARAAETRCRTENLPECRNFQWNDWLSLTKIESCPVKPEYRSFERDASGKRVPTADALVYWNYLGACYWAWDAKMMSEMAAATGRKDAVAKYAKMAGEAKDYLRKEFFTGPEGTATPVLAGMQTPALFALKLGLVEGAAREKTIADLKASFAACGGRFHTGFLGTSVLMDVLSANGMDSVAYDLLLGHEFPGWLYSVDQGATTVWERWNSYVRETGFGPVGMNSFNHYAYGAVLAWMYRTVAGIAADPSAPGFKRIVMAPKPDRRLGYVKAEYKSAAGLVKSAWRYEGDVWVWEFTVPEGAVARVTLPGESQSNDYRPGTYSIRR